MNVGNMYQLNISVPKYFAPLLRKYIFDVVTLTHPTLLYFGLTLPFDQRQEDNVSSSTTANVEVISLL